MSVTLALRLFIVFQLIIVSIYKYSSLTLSTAGFIVALWLPKYKYLLEDYLF